MHFIIRTQFLSFRYFSYFNFHFITLPAMNENLILNLMDNHFSEYEMPLKMNSCFLN